MAELEAFIDRNDKFQQKIHKKQNILNNTVKTHDLRSGVKLFSPKINKQPSNKFFTSGNKS